MSLDSDRHRVGPVLRTLAAIVALGAGAFAVVLVAVAVLPDQGNDLGTRLILLAFGGGFAFATWIFVVSAARGRSPAAVPVWTPWRQQLSGWLGAALFLAAVTATQLLRARFGLVISAVVVGVGIALLSSFLGRRARVGRTPDERAGR